MITSSTENYCSCIEFESKGGKGTPKVYSVRRGEKCSSVLPLQAHINSWCCLYSRWKDYLGEEITSDIDLFQRMAIDPDRYNQKVYPWGDYGWFGPYDTKEEAIAAANRQITENYLFWYVNWKTKIKIKNDNDETIYDTRNIPGIIGGFNIHGHTLNRDGDFCSATTYSSNKNIRSLKNKDGVFVDLWIWEVDGDNNTGTCGWKNTKTKASKMNCFSFSSLNEYTEFCNKNDYDATFNNNNNACWCCGSYSNLTSKLDLIKITTGLNIGPCGNPYQSDKRNGRFGRYDTRPGSSP
jgi:hypothetical protein